MSATYTLTTRIDLDIAAANGAEGLNDPAFIALCDRFETLLESECERRGWDLEVRKVQNSGAVSNTRLTSDEDPSEADRLEGDARDLVNECWERALVG